MEQRWKCPVSFLGHVNFTKVIFSFNSSEAGFQRGPQTFIHCVEEKIQQSPLQYSAVFASRQSRVDLMTFQIID